MKNAVVFTGLPRMPDRFKRSISEMKDLESRGLIDTIIFVTWEGRLDAHGALREFLHENDVEILEKKEAQDGGSGNIWHQMRALDHGLRGLSSDYRVLKTRTDVHINSDFLEDLFSGDIAYRETAAGSSVFEERIWVPFFKLVVPFYICDYCFYGRKADLEKLVNYDARFDVLYHVPKGLPEVRRYALPYLTDYSFLESYFENYRHEAGGERLLDRRGLLDSRLNSDVYSSFMSFYYKIMIHDFYVDYSPVTFQDGWWVPDGRPDENLADIESSFMDNLRLGPDQGRHDLFCYQTSWLEAQFVATPNEDVTEQVLAGIEKPFEEWARYEIGRDELRRDIERDRAFFDLTTYPDYPLIDWLTERVLAPLGLRSAAKRAYRSVSWE